MWLYYSNKWLKSPEGLNVNSHGWNPWKVNGQDYNPGGVEHQLFNTLNPFGVGSTRHILPWVLPMAIHVQALRACDFKLSTLFVDNSNMKFLKVICYYVGVFNAPENLSTCFLSTPFWGDTNHPLFFDFIYKIITIFAKQILHVTTYLIMAKSP